MLTFVRSCAGWAVGVFAVVCAVLCGGLVQAQGDLNAALARVKLTDMSAKTCAPNAVWRIEIVDPDVLKSWNSFLDTVNPIIRKLMYDGCNGISTFVADIQFKGQRIAATPGTIYPEENPDKYVRDPAFFAQFKKQWNEKKQAEDTARTMRMQEAERVQAERSRVAAIEGAQLKAEEGRKKELDITSAMQIGGPEMAPYHIRECHLAEGKPRSTSNLTERDICEALFRAGLSTPATMVFPGKPVCNVVHKKGGIPLARCRYGYETVSDFSKRDRSDVTAEVAGGVMTLLSGIRLPGTDGALPAVSVVAADSRENEMPRNFYFDILKRQWEPNGPELKRIYEMRTFRQQERDKKLTKEAEEAEAHRLCRQTEVTKANRDDCHAQAYDWFKNK